MYIEKKSTAKIPEVNGAVVDTRNVDDKTTNTYSARVIDEMNTYSTEEVIVGIWLEKDGTKKPLYRKVYYVDAFPNNGHIGIDSGLTNVSIKEIRGMYEQSHAFSINNTRPSDGTDNSSIGAYYLYSTNVIQLNCKADRSGYSGHIILEYTKTTD